MSPSATAQRSWFAALVGLVLSCGFAPTPLPLLDAGITKGNDGGSRVDAGQADAGLALADACPTLNRARCEYLARCGLIGFANNDLAACEAAFAQTWCGTSTWLTRVQPGVETLRYDPMRGQACAESFSTRSCTNYTTEPDVCLRMLVPNASLRQRCYDGYTECIEGVCRGATCPRTCQTIGQLADACRKNTDCRPPLFCRLSTTSPGIGACAQYSTIGGTCEVESDCADGLLCQLGTCKVRPSAGAACINERCDDSAYCVAGSDGGVCRARASQGGDCLTVPCAPGLVCTVGQTCEPEVLQSAAACSLPQLCPSGTQCVYSTTAADAGQCETARGPGSPCAWSTDCEAHLACVDRDGGVTTCGARLGEGASCRSTRDCRQFMACDNTRCVRQPGLGEACSSTRPCLAGSCVELDGGAHVCGAPGAPGARCSTSKECASGDCQQGHCVATCQP